MTTATTVQTSETTQWVVCVRDDNGERYASAPIDRLRDAQQMCEIVEGSWIEQCEGPAL